MENITSKQKNKPLVSVVIPTYNRPKESKKAVFSALDQTYENIEVVVVDDCSQDNTVDEIRSIKDDKVKIIEHNKNQGAGAARNTGIKNANGKYIAFLDSDDCWLPSKIEKQVDKLEKSGKEFKICYCYKYQRFAGSNILRDPEYDSKEGDIHDDLLSGWMNTVTSQLVIERACFKDGLNFDTEFPSFQEHDLMVRLSQKYKVKHVDTPLLVQLVANSNSISGDYKNRKEGFEKFLNKYENEIENLYPGGKTQFRKDNLESISRLKMITEIENKNYSKGLRAFKKYFSLNDSKLRACLVVIILITLGRAKLSKIVQTRRLYSSI